ncbi:MAG: hypothetical protein RLZZ515_1926, partial [Cyanobacteriota bacterium]
MDRYLNDIARYPLMSPDEEIRLGKIVRASMALKAEGRELTAAEQRVVRRGDKAVRRFVEANLRLVVYIAKRYAARKPHAMDMLDLVQEGAIGLVRAAEMFDPERGYKFSTYSFWWCRQAMSRALQNQERMIRRPCTVAELAGKLNKAAQQETQRLGRSPSTAELAAAARFEGLLADTIKARDVEAEARKVLAVTPRQTGPLSAATPVKKPGVSMRAFAWAAVLVA